MHVIGVCSFDTNVFLTLKSVILYTVIIVHLTTFNYGIKFCYLLVSEYVIFKNFLGACARNNYHASNGGCAGTT